jgi:hypothetical protein
MPLQVIVYNLRCQPIFKLQICPYNTFQHLHAHLSFHQLIEFEKLMLSVQVSTLHCAERVLYSCFSDTSDANDENSFASEISRRDRDCADENFSNSTSPDASWLELEGIVSFNESSANHKNEKATALSNSIQFETELRQHMHDLLHYIDDLERQVCLLIA